MLTHCKDKNGTALRVESRPDLSGRNPGGTICEVHVRTGDGWIFSRSVTLSRHQYSDTSIERSVVRYMSTITFR